MKECKCTRCAELEQEIEELRAEWEDHDAEIAFWNDLAEQLYGEANAKKEIERARRDYAARCREEWEERYQAHMQEQKNCNDCRSAPHAGPMLHDSVWNTIADRHARLCFSCIERRLGRPLVQADLTNVPFNAGWIEFDAAKFIESNRGKAMDPRTFRKGGAKMLNAEAAQFARVQGRTLLPRSTKVELPHRR